MIDLIMGGFSSPRRVYHRGTTTKRRTAKRTTRTGQSFRPQSAGTGGGFRPSWGGRGGSPAQGRRPKYCYHRMRGKVLCPPGARYASTRGGRGGVRYGGGTFGGGGSRPNLATQRKLDNMSLLNDLRGVSRRDLWKYQSRINRQRPYMDQWDRSRLDDILSQAR